MIFTSPSCYVQGPDVIDRLRVEIEKLGGRPVLIVDAGIAESVGTRIRLQYEGAAAPLLCLRYAGEVTQTCVDAFLHEIRPFDADVVVGAGGGKALDAAKAVALSLSLPFVSVPTIAATDAPASFAIAMYNEAHELVEVRRLRRNPELVVVDTAVICSAPVRFLRAGIGDAISKFYETEATLRAGALNLHGHPPSSMGVAAARLCHEAILQHGAAALAEVKAGKAGVHAEKLIEATVLLSAMASENGGLSIAHAVARGIPVVTRSAGSLHGEHVAFGLLVQLVLEGRPMEMVRMLKAYRDLCLPSSLAGVGLSQITPSELDQLVDATAGSESFQRFERQISASELRNAILDADRQDGYQ